MKRFLVAFAALMIATTAQADPALGLWKTEPDRKNLTSHIVISRCADALCGTVKAAFNSAGQAVQTPNVGKRLFWDMQAQGGGRYDGGTVFVPLLNVQARASMVLNGNRLTVTGCKGLICDGQTWTRVQ